MLEKIVVKGAKENNLKNIDVVIPRNKLVVFTGVSGSGKSTLAFDTIFAEGQRRYVESLSSYARMFLGQMQKPDVERIDGLSPAISIDQKTTSHNPRSTVGTVTEIYDYLRLLYARVGVPHCPNCGRKIESQTIDQIIDKVKELGQGAKFIILAPVVRGQKGTFAKLLENARKDGYVRVEVDGETYDLDDNIALDKNKKHNISIVIDRLILKDGIDQRLNDSIETAINCANGLVIIKSFDKEMLYSTSHACTHCNVSIGEITPRLFSFNNPFGACEGCNGLGVKMEIDPQKFVKPNLTINEGAVYVSGWNMEPKSISAMYMRGLSEKYNFSLDVPFKDLPKKIQDIVLYGTGTEEVEFTFSSRGGKTRKFVHAYEGIVNNLERRYKETNSESAKSDIGRFMVERECPDCHGQRLKPEALAVKIDNKNINEVCDLSISEAVEFINKIELTAYQYSVAEQILKEIKARLHFLVDVGLDYLTLSRASSTLSGGESQRIRLASQIGSGLTGVLYILDEPSIGLHQRDNERLLLTLQHLRDLGNSVIVVEHDEDTIKSADYIVDIGPFAGERGGELVYSGDVEGLKACERSITGQYVSGTKKIEVPAIRRKVGENFLEIRGAKQNNLKNINLKLPLGVFNVVTGVSGSGKSSLITETLWPALSNRLNNSQLAEGKYSEILGVENCDKAIFIDQNPIGRTPRSNPATYCGIFTTIRELFSKTQDARERGYEMGRFSFNVSGGRCEACSGDGIKKIEMYFLPDVYVPCEVCKGKRYNRETLEVKYKGKSIFDVLDMTVEEALTFFDSVPQLKNKIQTLYDVGLGYIKLGQPATTLSGGEAQRVKLATELAKRNTGKTVYILDEPTTGLSMYDVDKLINILQRLVSGGNTVVVIEHNLDLIKVADYIVDIGPEGGEKGGKILVAGTPEKVAKCTASYTGKFLKQYL